MRKSDYSILVAGLKARGAGAKYLADSDAYLTAAKVIEMLASEVDAAISEMSNQARARGEAEGRLMTSQMAGVVEGWRQRALDAERELEALKTAPRVEFHQHDFIAGFAAFMPGATTPSPDSRAFCVLNLGAFLAAVSTGALSKTDVPYLIAETMMHEIIHVLEQWAGVEFSEDRVEAFLTKYRSTR